MQNNNNFKKLGEYEVNKVRAEPQKYLWDALDRYFGVLNITAGSVYKMQELLTMRIWAADDVEATADACELISLDDNSDYLNKLGPRETIDLEAKNKLARRKVGLVLKAMKKSQVGKINLELKQKGLVTEKKDTENNTT